MKRLLIPLALAAALVGAAGALAIPVDTEYNGHAKGDAGGSFVGFDVKKASNGTRKVKHFQVSGLDFECGVGSPGQTGLSHRARAFAKFVDGALGGGLEQ